MLLLHGLSGSSRWWRPVARALEEDHRVEGIDLTGFGERRRSGRFDLGSAAADIAEEMSRRAAAPAAVIGHSLGGLIAARLAVERPECVSRLVLVSAPLFPFSWGVRRHVVNLVRLVPRLAPDFVPILLRDAVRAGPATLASATAQLLGTAHPEGWSRIGCPTLLVWGGRDRLVPPSMGRRAAEQIPGARYVEIPDAGHVPMWERRKEFTSLVRSFLDEGRARS